MSRSEAEPPKRIPIPAEQRWQWVRVRVTPVIVFAAVVFTLVVLWNAYVAVPMPPGSDVPRQASTPQLQETEAVRPYSTEDATKRVPPLRTVPPDSARGSGQVSTEADHTARATIFPPHSVH